MTTVFVTAIILFLHGHWVSRLMQELQTEDVELAVALVSKLSLLCLMLPVILREVAYITTMKGFWCNINYIVFKIVRNYLETGVGRPIYAN